MNKIIIFSILIIANSYLFGQNVNANWYFGSKCGISFNTIPPSFLPGSPMNPTEGVVSVSDGNGNFIFCSDGVTVWDANLDTMPNGTGLYGNYSSSQSCISFPDPGDHTKYYIFTAPVEGSSLPLSVSGIDMNLNNGLGSVTFKNMPLLNNSTEKLTAVYHRNGIDVWVLGHKYASNQFYAYLVTAAGLNTTPVISSIGMHHGPPADQSIGYMKFSPCGDKLAVAVSIDGFLEIYDFDNATGIVSNNILLGNYTGLNPGVYGVEFSPDGSRLYATFTNASLIGQYDLNAGSPAAIINSFDTVHWAYPNFYPAGLQTGPDGRIYVIIIGNNSLSCITEPNLSAPACDFQYNYVYAGPLVNGSSGLGLPNYVTSYFCNLNVSIFESEASKNEFEINPTLSNGNFTLRFTEFTNTINQLDIVDIYGNTVYQKIIPTNSYTYEINLNLADGVYLCVLSNVNGVSFNKIAITKSN